MLQFPDIYHEAVDFVYGGRIKIASITSYHSDPGDIITFNYNNEESPRRMFVVATQRGPDGGFISNTGKYLICGFDLTSIEAIPSITFIFEHFYKRKRSSYKSLRKILSLFFGKNTFKTFDTALIHRCYSLEIKK